MRKWLRRWLLGELEDRVEFQRRQIEQIELQLEAVNNARVGTILRAARDAYLDGVLHRADGRGS